MKVENWKFNIFIYTAIYVAGFGSSFVFFGRTNMPNNRDNQANIGQFIEHRQGQYKLINPLLACDIAEETLTNPLGVSRFKLRDAVDDQLAKKNADHISLYFRDLNNGPWIGVGEKEEFIGASLMKVPLMIAYLKKAESDPAILEAKIRYGNLNPQVSLDQFFKTDKEIKLGEEYTIEELIDYMIMYSDNNAADLLGKNINSEDILNVFLALGVGLPDFNKPYPINVRTYGSFFRILFNSSYLSKEMSEKALEKLAANNFKYGISVPIHEINKDIVVAEKHGIREIGDLGSKQLHDCGIIYYPNHPYLLCIMTQGNDFNKLSGVIQDISELVYRQISEQKTSWNRIYKAI